MFKSRTLPWVYFLHVCLFRSAMADNYYPLIAKKCWNFQREETTKIQKSQTHNVYDIQHSLALATVAEDNGGVTGENDEPLTLFKRRPATRLRSQSLVSLRCWMLSLSDCCYFSTNVAGAISSPEFRNPFTVIVVRGTVGKIFHNLRKTKIEKKNQIV